MKIAALDIGDSWTGVALSDALKIIAKPYQTIATQHLISFLENLLTTEKIETVIIGYPKTMKGNISEQTLKTEKVKEVLEKKFTQKKFVLWDERLSSKRAESLKKAQTKEEKIKSHAIAAAFILETYLNYLHISKDQENNF